MQHIVHSRTTTQICSDSWKIFESEHSFLLIQMPENNHLTKKFVRIPKLFPNPNKVEQIKFHIIFSFNVTLHKIYYSMLPLFVVCDNGNKIKTTSFKQYEDIDMEINRIKLNHFHNKEHFRFHTEFCNAVINMNHKILKIRTHFDTYFALYRQADEALSKTTAEYTPKEIRAQIDTACRAVTERIEALIIIEGARNYERFIRQLNTIITKYNDMLTHQQGRS